MGGIVDEETLGFDYYDYSQYVTDQTPLASSYYSGDDTTYKLNAWLIDIADENVRATVGDTIPINEDRLTEVTSSNPSVASVEDGKIICHKEGRANITRTDATYVSHYFVLVSDKTTISLSKSKYILEKGKSETITPKVTNASTSEITYSSSDKTVAKVNSNGKIVANKKGKATITVKLGNLQEKIAVTVKDNPVPKITGLKNSYTIIKGKELKIPFIIENAEDLTISVTGGKGKFKISDGLYEEFVVAKIAKVTNDYVAIKGIEKGKTTITIEVGTVTKKVTINVK